MVSRSPFGTVSGAFDLAYGGVRWGNFFAVDGLNSGRLLDPQEFSVIHAKGNLEDAFDRVDYQFSVTDTIHVNLGYSRSRFQTPNSYDNFNVGVVAPPMASLLGPQTSVQKSKPITLPRPGRDAISPSMVFTLGGYVRHDGYNYYPSGNPFATSLRSSRKRMTRTER